MPIVVLKLPDVKRKAETRPRKCPYCGGGAFQRWGQVRKPVRDTRWRSVGVYRYRCCGCGRTFRHYPQGTSRADQSERLRLFAVMCWRMGLSHRGVSCMLSGLGLSLSHMSSWRDAQAQAEQVRRQQVGRKVRVLGLDGAYVLGWGQKRAVQVAVDLGNGEVVALGNVDENNPQAVRHWLQPLAEEWGVEVIVTDDLFSYRIVAEELHLKHQVCGFHLRRWVGRSLRDLKEQVPKACLGLVEEVEFLIKELPALGDQRLYEMWEELLSARSAKAAERRALKQLRELLLRLSQHWQTYRTFLRVQDVPWTNNGSEQAIGKMKMRARTVRGYKTWPGMQTGMLLAGCLNF